MIARGVTLLELLIALALLAAMAALSAPLLLDRMDERSFETAADGVVAQLRLARAHAQASGEAVEVAALDDGRVVTAQRFAGGEAIDAPRTIAEPWAQRELVGGASIVDRRPRADAEDIESLLAIEPPRAPTGRPAAPIRLAIFLPDGSAMPGRAAWLREGDRVGRVFINPFTGLAGFEREPDLGGVESNSAPLAEDPVR